MVSRHLPERLLDERGKRDALGASIPLGFREQLGVHGYGELLLHRDLIPFLGIPIVPRSIRVYGIAFKAGGNWFALDHRHRRQRGDTRLLPRQPERKLASLFGAYRARACLEVLAEPPLVTG